MFNCIWHNDVLQKQNFILKKRNFHFIFLHKTKKMKKYLKKVMTMFNFIWLDIDSSWQTSDSKWLDRFFDSTLTRLDHVMTRLWLDWKKIRMTLTRLWLEGLVTRLDSWLDKYDSSTSLPHMKCGNVDHVWYEKLQILNFERNLFIDSWTIKWDVRKWIRLFVASQDIRFRNI